MTRRMSRSSRRSNAGNDYFELVNRLPHRPSLPDFKRFSSGQVTPQMLIQVASATRHIADVVPGPLQCPQRPTTRGRDASANGGCSSKADCGATSGRTAAVGRTQPSDAVTLALSLPPTAALAALFLRHVAGGSPNSRLNARLNEASDS